MKPSELRPEHIALFARKITDISEYEELSTLEMMECEDALAAAMGVAGAYAGIDVNSTELEDVTYAIKAIAAEMIDNHQISTQFALQNPMAMQILDLHSTNLLPSVEV